MVYLLMVFVSCAYMLLLLLVSSVKCRPTFLHIHGLVTIIYICHLYKFNFSFILL